MPTTTNYGWTTPADTDLVKDGASAIRTLGTAIDTTTKNLNPETTLGDIAYRSSTSNVKTRLALGTAGQLLQVNSGATAPEWATIQTGGMTSLASGSIASSATGFDLTSISTSYNDLILYMRNFSISTTANLLIHLNNDTTSNYWFINDEFASGTASTVAGNGETKVRLTNTISASRDGLSAYFIIYDYKNTTAFKSYEYYAIADYNKFAFGKGHFNDSSTLAITRITATASTGTFDSGTYELFGVK
jgi:hypothetical protein